MHGNVGRVCHTCEGPLYSCQRNSQTEDRLEENPHTVHRVKQQHLRVLLKLVVQATCTNQVTKAHYYPKRSTWCYSIISRLLNLKSGYYFWHHLYRYIHCICTLSFILQYPPVVEGLVQYMTSQTTEPAGPPDHSGKYIHSIQQ